MNYLDWEENVPETIREDALWKMKVYRMALFMSDICWKDVSKLSEDIRTKSLSNQLYRSVGSIAANLEEGYSKQSAKDRARFYEYALGSARESRGWFYRARHILGEAVHKHRSELLTEIIKMLLKIVPEERASTLREDTPDYMVDPLLKEKVPL